jgi:translation initiation factor 1
MSSKRPLNTSPDRWNNPFAALAGDHLPDGEIQSTAPPPKLGRIVLRKETAHRGGKTVIVVDDFAPNITSAFIAELAGRLKKQCGCGGTVKGRQIEIQGDQPGKIRAVLEAAGFRVAGVR